MTTEPPRRLRPSGAARAKTILTQTRGAQSAQGSTGSARPVPDRPRSKDYQPRGLAPDRLGRLSVNWFTNDAATDLPTRRHNITSWPSTFDSNGTQIGLNPGGDDGSIYFFSPGVYAVNLILEATDIGGSAADCSIRFQAQIWDTPDSAEIFDVGSRGGDMGGAPGEAPSPGASRVIYSPGGGVDGGGMSFDIVTVNLDPLVVTVWVLATVQQIA